MDPIDTTSGAAGAATADTPPTAPDAPLDPAEGTGVAPAPEAAAPGAPAAVPEPEPEPEHQPEPEAEQRAEPATPLDPVAAEEPSAATASPEAESATPDAATPDAAAPEPEAGPTADRGVAPSAAPTMPVSESPAEAAGSFPPPPGSAPVAPPVVAGEPTAPAMPEGAAIERTASGLHSGQIVEGRVVSVSGDEAVLELGDGSTGVISKRHLTANGQLDPTELLAVGDGVEAAVLIRDDPKGRIVLSRAWALKQRAWEQVEAAKSANRPLTGRVTGQVKGGLVVDVGTRAFLPASQVDLHHVDDLSTFVGQDIEALVQEADRANDKIVLSRRNLLRSAQRSKANEFASTLAAGQVHRGRVSLLTDFGAFVEIGGVRGLVHLSELSWSRVDRADEVVTPGTEVEVKVLAVKPGKKLSLSIRALTPDPLTTLQPGQILPGVVTRLADFGAFVRVGDGAEGLVHVTELAEYRVHAPEEVVTPGDEVLVKVLRIDRKRRRLDLSVNQALLS